MKQSTPRSLAFLDDAIAEARSRQLFRDRSPSSEPSLLRFCSNDYLDLGKHLAPPAAGGAGASRLVSGDLPIHARLEVAAADLVCLPAALVFTSGYAANVGALSALAGPGDLIVSDALNHASIIDGARLSRAAVHVVPHLDVAAVAATLRSLRRRRAFVVTESYFSMDADQPDLAALRAVCDEHCAVLVVDEAHALGVLGPEGRGVCAAAGVVPDVLVGTFGKAFGAGGAFVAGCTSLSQWLWNRARSFVFSTGLSPVVAAAALQGIEKARTETWRRLAVNRMAERMRAGLGRAGVEAVGAGHIVPWIVGSPQLALVASRWLREQGVDVRAIRPPSVPSGTARLRLTVTAGHAEAAVDRAVEAIAAIARWLRT